MVKLKLLFFLKSVCQITVLEYSRTLVSHAICAKANGHSSLEELHLNGFQESSWQHSNINNIFFKIKYYFTNERKFIKSLSNSGFWRISVDVLRICKANELWKNYYKSDRNWDFETETLITNMLRKIIWHLH